MKPFHESSRYEYNLTPDSLVLDCGGYEGNFAFTLAEKYGCRVVCHEPIKRFHQGILGRMIGSGFSHLIFPVNAGVGATARKETFQIKGCMTGIVASGEEKEEVTIVSILTAIDTWLGKFGVPTLALLKLNIEGMEFEVLEALLDHGYASRIDNLQIQFHGVVPQARERRDAIRNRLRITHRPAWEVPADLDVTWDGWEIAQ